MERDLEAAAARGAKFLDKQIVDWYTQINMSQLDLGSCDKCIIGQLFGEYGHIDNLSRPFTFRYTHGFSAPIPETGDRDERWNTLRRAWIKEIRTRRVDDRRKKSAKRSR